MTCTNPDTGSSHRNTWNDSANIRALPAVFIFLDHRHCACVRFSHKDLGSRKYKRIGFLMMGSRRCGGIHYTVRVSGCTPVFVVGFLCFMFGMFTYTELLGCNVT